MHVHLITAEDPLTLHARARELIRFPQLTMPLLAALTPPNWTITHTDEITHSVDKHQHYDLVGITAATPGAPHAYDLANSFRVNGVKVVMVEYSPQPRLSAWLDRRSTCARRNPSRKEQAT
jgi:protein-L-isoaspartate O-methyltransferase